MIFTLFCTWIHPLFYDSKLLIQGVVVYKPGVMIEISTANSLMIQCVIYYWCHLWKYIPSRGETTKIGCPNCLIVFSLCNLVKFWTDPTHCFIAGNRYLSAKLLNNFRVNLGVIIRSPIISDTINAWRDILGFSACDRILWLFQYWVVDELMLQDFWPQPTSRTNHFKVQMTTMLALDRSVRLSGMSRSKIFDPAATTFYTILLLLILL